MLLDHTTFQRPPGSRKQGAPSVQARTVDLPGKGPTTPEQKSRRRMVQTIRDRVIAESRGETESVYVLLRQAQRAADIWCAAFFVQFLLAVGVIALLTWAV